MARDAMCSCGQLRATVEGEPIRVSVCHCLSCQRRTGSPFAQQARFPAGRVRITGRSTQYVRRSDEDDAEARMFHFCPDCGTTVYYVFEPTPEIIVVPVGVFADPAFPPPQRSVWEERRHPWVSVPEGAERCD